MWTSFVAVFRKEFLHVRRDRGTLVAALAIPLFQLLLFGFIDQTVRDLPTVVVDQDRTSYARGLIDALRATGTFRVVRLTGDASSARDDLIAGRARVGIVIPPDLHDRRARGQSAAILVLIDGSDSTVSAQALAAVSGLVATCNLEALARARAVATQPGPPVGLIEARPVLLFNPDGRTANFIIPGLVAILLQLVALVFAAVAIVRERERGTLEQLMVTPVHPLGLVLGKLAPYLIIGLAEMALVLLAMRFAFDVPIRGSLLFLFVMAVVYVFALLALGLFISTRARTQAQAQQLAQLFFLPSVFLSGYIFPTAGLPGVLRAVGLLLPATHMVAILRGVVLRDAGPGALAPHVLALLVLAAALVWASARRFRKAAL